MLDIPLRTVLNPFLSIKETNDLLQHLKSLDLGRRNESTKYGSSHIDVVGKRKAITIIFSDDLPTYSIFTTSVLSSANDFFDITQPRASYPGFIVTPNLDKDSYRNIYCTNGGQDCVDGSIFDCDIIGDDRPHLIRFDGPTPIVGDRMDFYKPSPPGFPGTYFFSEPYLVKSPTGPFVAVSKGDSDRKLVWIIVHNHQLSYIPWVQTCIIPGPHPYGLWNIYPDESSNANLFAVRRGVYDYETGPNDSPGYVDGPGYKNAIFKPYVPAQYNYAYHPCGWLPEGTVRRMTLDHGMWYLTQDCGLPPYSSSSVSMSSASSSSSGQSSSSSGQSSSSSGQSSSSSGQSSSSSGQSSSSSGQSSSSSGQSSSSSGSSSSNSSPSSPTGPPAYCCWFEWFDEGGLGGWEVHEGCSLAGCPPTGHCRYDVDNFLPPFAGAFNGDIVLGSCIV